MSLPGTCHQPPMLWLLVHTKMLILAPTPPDDNNSTISINICITTCIKLFHVGQIKILKLPRGSGTGVMDDVVDTFISLIKLGNKDLNDNIHNIFDLVYRNAIPPKLTVYLTDTYILCFFKDPDNPTKLCPIRIPLAMHHILAGHVSTNFCQENATHIISFNWAIGVHQGIDSIIKAMQLSIEKYIVVPQ